MKNIMKSTMKNVFVMIAAFVMLVAFTMSAAFAYSKEQAVEFCTGESTIAGTIMMARQIGVPMSTVMQQTPQDNILWIGYVEEAYALPRYDLKVNQDKAQVDFSNKVFEQCWKAVKGKVKKTTRGAL